MSLAQAIRNVRIVAMAETPPLDAEMSELAMRIAQLTLGLSNKAAWLHIRRLVQAYDPPVPNRARCATHAAVWGARKEPACRRS